MEGEASTLSNPSQADPSDQVKEKSSSTNKQDEKHKHNKGVAKRKREDPYVAAYQSIRFDPILPDTQDVIISRVPYGIHTALPGTPARQFAHSFHAKINDQSHGQVVHQHANGLCIVTPGPSKDLPAREDVVKIEFLVRVYDGNTGKNLRKLQAKCLSGKQGSNGDGTVMPDTEIARLHLRNDKYISLFAFVWGTILELNSSVTPQQLVQDPMLEGYLAVILPTGPFPPCLV